MYKLYLPFLINASHFCAALITRLLILMLPLIFLNRCTICDLRCSQLQIYSSVISKINHKRREKKVNILILNYFYLILNYLGIKCFDETASLFKRKIPRVVRSKYSSLLSMTLSHLSAKWWIPSLENVVSLDKMESSGRRESRTFCEIAAWQRKPHAVSAAKEIVTGPVCDVLQQPAYSPHVTPSNTTCPDRCNTPYTIHISN